MAEGDVAAWQLLQERQTSHLPNHDDTKPLRMALQLKENPLYGEVSPQ